MPAKPIKRKKPTPPKANSLFKGPHKKGDIQTVDAGAGFGDYVFRQASQFGSTRPTQRRRYAAVEPFMSGAIYGFSKKLPQDPLDRQIVIRNIIRLKEGYRKLKSIPTVEIVPYEVVPFMREMISNKRKTRHLSINMPFHLENYDFKQLFTLLPKVIYPNGKVFITSESKFGLEQIKKISQEVQAKGPDGKLLKKPRALKIVEISPEELFHRIPSDLMKQYGKEGKKVYRLVLVIPPQK